MCAYIIYCMSVSDWHAAYERDGVAAGDDGPGDIGQIARLLHDPSLVVIRING